MTDLRLGVAEQLYVILHRDHEHATTHATYVADVDTHSLRLAWPEGGAKVFRPDLGESLRLVVLRVDGLYQGETQLQRINRKEPIPFFEVSHPEIWSRCQRRTFVRVNCSLVLQWWGEEKEEGDRPQGNGRTLDLSAGGAAFISDKAIDVGANYSIRLHLPSGPLDLVGVIRREEDHRNRRRYAVEFLDLGSNEEDQIMAYVFHQQRTLRRKGLL